MQNFKVSVIIPVFNAVKFIKSTIESIIHQDGVGEVIVVDDGFKDGALELCRELEVGYDKLTVLTHTDNANLGAGASRNLAIERARYEYIAFLDADDYCLPGRFQVTRQVFLSDSAIDGVYEPIGTHFVNQVAKEKFMKWKRLDGEEAESYVTYPRQETSGRQFCLSLLEGSVGYPSIVGLTVKKSLIERVGYFDTSLKLHQDTELLIRLAYYGNLAPGNKNHIVANRVVHPENRISNESYFSRYLLMKKLWHWAKTNSVSVDVKKIIKEKYIVIYTKYIFKSESFFVKVFYNVLKRII